MGRVPENKYYLLLIKRGIVTPVNPESQVHIVSVDRAPNISLEPPAAPQKE